MPKSIIIKKNGGPEVLKLQDVNVGSPGHDEIKVVPRLFFLGSSAVVIEKSSLHALPKPRTIVHPC